ncbi:MAG: hypothetical protein LBG27_00675 [Spirochaetaceae bacterium]|nr:hypothetical protein [Spirochaetaceae bacterium]
MNIHGGYIIDMDISKYFDTIPHEKLREILGLRVSDGVIQRTIGKWLNAGVMERGNVAYQEKETPQGGVISPIFCKGRTAKIERQGIYGEVCG